MQIKAIVLSLTVLLFATSIPVAAQDKITVKLENVSLSTAVAAIEKASAYTFFYDAQSIDMNVKVNLTANNEDIQDAVSKMLTTTSVSCIFKGRQIALVPKAAAPEGKPVAKNISGKVLDENGLAVIGAAVMVGKDAAITDLDGAFSITLHSSAKTATVSCLGYKETTVNITSTPMTITLSEDSTELSESVVVGYGTQSKRLVSSSIATVKMDDIDRGAEIDPIKSLQGRAPGVSISTSSGIPGEKPNVIIRGVSSISGNSGSMTNFRV